MQGRVLLISTYTSLVSMGTGVFIGIVVLDESWPSAPRMSLLRQVAQPRRLNVHAPRDLRGSRVLSMSPCPPSARVLRVNPTG
eukprot:scaffold11869_cov30-Tisochrysis_lutea.AAC.4